MLDLQKKTNAHMTRNQSHQQYMAKLDLILELQRIKLKICHVGLKEENECTHDKNIRHINLKLKQVISD